MKTQYERLLDALGAHEEDEEETDLEDVEGEQDEDKNELEDEDEDTDEDEVEDEKENVPLEEEVKDAIAEKREEVFGAGPVSEVNQTISLLCAAKSQASVSPPAGRQNVCFCV